METEYYAVYDTKAEKYLTGQISTDWDNLENGDDRQIVQISETLYQFIESHSDSSEQFVDLTDYQPEIPKLPFINLEINTEKLKRSNELWEKTEARKSRDL
jgi:hypothetical protein